MHVPRLRLPVRLVGQVHPLAALEFVAGVGADVICAGTTVDDISSCSFGSDAVVATTTAQQVSSVASVKAVVSKASVETVIVRAPSEDVIAGARADTVWTFRSADHVSPETPRENVWVHCAAQSSRAGLCDDCHLAAVAGKLPARLHQDRHVPRSGEVIVVSNREVCAMIAVEVAERDSTGRDTGRKVGRIRKSRARLAEQQQDITWEIERNR